jgi:hypothetical protein
MQPPHPRLGGQARPHPAFSLGKEVGGRFKFLPHPQVIQILGEVGWVKRLAEWTAKFERSDEQLANRDVNCTV